MKRDIFCTDEDCIQTLSNILGAAPTKPIPIEILKTPGAEIDRPLPDDEHIRIVHGTAARDLRCDFCNRYISEGQPALAVSLCGSGQHPSDAAGWEFGRVDGPYLNRVGPGPLRA